VRLRNRSTRGVGCRSQLRRRRRWLPQHDSVLFHHLHHSNSEHAHHSADKQGPFRIRHARPRRCLESRREWQLRASVPPVLLRKLHSHAGLDHVQHHLHLHCRELRDWRWLPALHPWVLQRCFRVQRVCGLRDRDVLDWLWRFPGFSVSVVRGRYVPVQYCCHHDWGLPVLQCRDLLSNPSLKPVHLLRHRQVL